MSDTPTREISITIDESIDESMPVDALETWLHWVMEQALHQALSAEQIGQVSLLLTDDTTVQELNRKYRGLNEVTDVLSFSADFPGHWEGDEEVPDNFSVDGEPGAVDFVLPPEQVPPLGEVVVSYPQARRQAAEKGGDLNRELALLIVHGVLHLVGHDHLEAADTALMQSKEQTALEYIFQIGVPAS